MPKPNPRHFYTDAEADPKVRRYNELSDKIEEFRTTHRLWNTPEEDPEVQRVLDEFDELTREVHPVLSDPLSFHKEDWTEDTSTPEESND